MLIFCVCPNVGSLLLTKVNPKNLGLGQRLTVDVNKQLHVLGANDWDLLTILCKKQSQCTAVHILLGVSLKAVSIFKLNNFS